MRWLYLPQKAISFAYDQARDAFIVSEMLQGHLKVLGPPVSGVPGLFHGVLYYYVVAPAYYFGHGDPVIVAYFLSFISSFGVFAVYYFAKILTKEKIPGLIAALIFAFSFESTQYANLLTNASIGAWFTPVLYIGLYLWITRSTNSGQAKSSKFGPILTGLGLGLAIQSEIALAYHFTPVLIWIFVYRKNINKKQIFIFVISLIAVLSSMILSEIKFGFTGVHGIIYLLSGGDAIAQSRNLSDYLVTLISQFGKTFAYSIFPLSLVLGGVIGFLVIIISIFLNSHEIKNKILTWETFLISWIFAYGVALPFGGSNMKHILVGVAPAVVIYVGIFIWKYVSSNKFVLGTVLIFILSSNLLMVLKENKNGQTIFPLQGDLVLQKEISVVDYSYQKSNNKPFSISSLTSPLFVNTLWSYLYNWHGIEKYGYLPFWVGRDQIGQLGNNLQFAPSGVSDHYYIMEPTYGIPELYVNYAKGDQDAVSKYIDKASFGQLVIEERQIKDDKK